MFVSLIVQYVIIDVSTMSIYGNLIESSWRVHTMSLVDWCHYYIYEFMKIWLKTLDKLILCHQWHMNAYEWYLTIICSFLLYSINICSLGHTIENV